MKVLPERETLWSWLSSSAALMWKVFELPVESSSPATAHAASPEPPSRHAADALEEAIRLAGNSKNKEMMTEEDLVPDLMLVNDTLN